MRIINYVNSGNWRLVLSIGLFAASIFAAVILPVATAFYVCEAFGFEAGIDKTWEEAPRRTHMYDTFLFFHFQIKLPVQSGECRNAPAFGHIRSGNPEYWPVPLNKME